MKTQMKFQKIMCLTLLIVAALSAVYALCYCTGILAGIGSTTSMDSGNFITYTDEDYPDLIFTEAMLYKDADAINDALFYLGIVMILLVAVLYITSTNKRRNYYVSNYVATGVVAAGNIGISIYCLVQNANLHGRVLDEILNNPSALAVYREIANINTTVADAYSESTVMFTLGYILYAVIIVMSIVLVLNAVWKAMLMKGEKQLLNQSFAKEVA